jgi:hypothetical protein
MQADTKLVTPPKFNHNSTIKTSTTEKFSCFPTIKEEETDEFTDTEETQSEIDTEGIEFENHLQGICSITEDKRKPLCNMATFHSTRTCLPKLACSALVVGLFTAGVFITGAYPHNHLVNELSDFERGYQTNSTTREPRTNQPSNETNSSTYLGIIQANNQVLQAQLEQALARIEQNIQKNKDLAERISRSPRAIQNIQALEAAIAIFGQNKPEPEYEVSDYATGNRRWKRSPAQHPMPIQDLLLYDVQNKHHQNKILGDKVAQVVRQNTELAQQISSAYETPSEKLKKDPIMGLVTKTVATYMFLRHNNSPRQNNNQKTEDFSSWGEPFFKKKE